MNDEEFMLEAVAEAHKAAKLDEVPIGAVAVLNDKIIERSHNDRERTKNPLGHAELLLLEKIFKENLLPSWRFDEVTIYVTCEPCIMCMGAMREAQIKRIVYGCKNPKAGACGSLYDLSSDKTTSGIMADECAKLLSDFFKKLRNQSSVVSR